MKAKITGVVLAGGQSRRMGTNKALLAVGKEKVIETIISAMTESVYDLLIAAGDHTADAYRELGLEIACDRFPGQGPLSGIHAALHAIKTPWIIVAACDMPFVSPELFRFLKKIVEEEEVVRARGEGIQAVIPLEGGRVQPLLAAYHISALPQLEEALLSGRLRMTDWLAQLRVRYITEEALLQETGLHAGHVFFNMNHPEDYHMVVQNRNDEDAE
ncbi:molybdenum cofactor guanylyltransferase [Paenibacillus sp.]|jgi:molybdopterin-guanine dinucleotide biosynthesis protein A|uniref:molybdenum cofactor guanylyltransferase n=1 Tax=Paenibacillus sp. TaxID=58172 RepID=UPI00281F74B1|nr:molybdenum cofactor guanylyltransferase [Paenibacillus sp.]MDR0269304.1 molybdenum cofactor guanylyltransferase [Paenibacillus sp.]